MTTLPALDARLQGVLGLILAGKSAQVHADIGSDHARLPLALAQSGQFARVIAVELNPGPLEVTRQALKRAGLSERVELRQGDGFGPLAAGEAQSVSLTGMGARTMLGIVQRAQSAGKLPHTLTVQPNAEAGALRRWAYGNGYWLADEQLLPGFWNYAALRLERAAGPDPIYTHLPLEAALHFGPQLLRRRDPLLRQELQRQQERLRPLLPFARAGVLEEWERVQAALDYLN